MDTRDERLRIAQAKLADTHRQLHNLQGETMQGLRRVVAGMQGGASATTEIIRANRDILDAATRALQGAERAADRADHTLKETIKILTLVNDAHDAMIALYETDSDLEDIAHSDPS